MIAALQAAVSYRERGWAVLPVQADKSPSPRALAATRGGRWHSLRNRPAAQAEVERWFRADPSAGVGIICQANLAVVDVDDFEHPDVPELPRTLTAQTPRPGLHRYFATAEPVGHRVYPWGELRAAGNYVVAPPSVGDRPYHWVIDVELAEPPEAFRSSPISLETSGRLLGEAVLGVSVERHEIAMLAVLGLEGVELGRAFHCPLHDDRRPSATLTRGRDGLLRLHCFAGCCGRQGWLSLDGAHAWRAGRRHFLNRTEMAIWAGDLRVRAGLLVPAAVPDFVGGGPEHLRPVWQGFRRLLGVRWLHRPGEPTPFTRRFAMAWCGVSEWEFRRQFSELQRRRMICPAGAAANYQLWLPGRGVVPV